MASRVAGWVARCVVGPPGATGSPYLAFGCLFLGPGGAPLICPLLVCSGEGSESSEELSGLWVAAGVGGCVGGASGVDPPGEPPRLACAAFLDASRRAAKLPGLCPLGPGCGLGGLASAAGVPW